MIADDIPLQSKLAEAVKPEQVKPIAPDYVSCDEEDDDVHRRHEAEITRLCRYMARNYAKAKEERVRFYSPDGGRNRTFK